MICTFGTVNCDKETWDGMGWDGMRGGVTDASSTHERFISSASIHGNGDIVSDRACKATCSPYSVQSATQKQA
jgi:hypothetical protein